MSYVEELLAENKRFRAALSQIASGAVVTRDIFAARIGERRSPTWFATNALQEYLEAASHTAREALNGSEL